MRINLVPDVAIEPGHQWIVLPNTPEGLALGLVLTNNNDEAARFVGDELHVPHNGAVDARIVELIDWLAHVRYSAHSLIQLTFIEEGHKVPESPA